MTPTATIFLPTVFNFVIYMKMIKKWLWKLLNEFLVTWLFSEKKIVFKRKINKLWKPDEKYFKTYQ